MNNMANFGRMVSTALTPMTTGKTFYVAGAGSLQMLQELFNMDEDGMPRVFTKFGDAVGQCRSGAGDVIVIANDFMGVKASEDIDLAFSKGVVILGDKINSDYITVSGEAKTLPQSTAGDLFKINGLVEVVSIIGVVKTAIQNQANNTKLQCVSNEATTDICAVLDIKNAGKEDRFNITGTVANAMVKTAKGVPAIRQATSLVMQDGSIKLNCAASNTGAIQWNITYRPLEIGAYVVAL